MAFTAAYLLLLQSFLATCISAADPLINASPSMITLGTTTSLDIRCTFTLNNHPGMAALISLVLSRASDTGQSFQELAAVTEFTPNSANLLTQESVSATGRYSPTAESYLDVTWQNPTTLQSGVYKCSALGVDNIGHNMEMTNTILVTVDEGDANDILNQLKQMQLQIAVLENNNTNLLTQVGIMSLYINALEENVLHLESTVPLIQKVSGWFPLGKYRDHFYYLNTENHGDINDAISGCRAFGGELAVMNDQDEYVAIRRFLGYTYGIVDVIIAGTDEGQEGHWVLPNTNTPMPFTAWYSGTPQGGTTYNCVALESGVSWLMVEATCHGAPTDGWRYMCEIYFS